MSAAADAARRPKIDIVLIAAVADNGVIGRAGGMPWRLKSDMQHFRAATFGKPVVMGRQTFLSIGKPLAGRSNIVVSRDRSFGASGIAVAPSIETALAVARADALRRGAAAIAIIGGADIYAQTMNRADRLIITHVHLQPQGDAKFPAIDPDTWNVVSRSVHPPDADLSAGFTITVYEPHLNGVSRPRERQ